MAKKLRPVFFLMLALCSVPTPSNSATPDGYDPVRLIEQFEPKEFSKTIVQTFLIQLFVTLVHEFGHALAAKHFYDSPIDIHIGKGQEAWFKIGPVSFDSWHVSAGYSNVIPSFKKTLLVGCIAEIKAKGENVTNEEAQKISQFYFSDEQREKRLPTYKRQNAIIYLAGATTALFCYILAKAAYLTYEHKTNHSNTTCCSSQEILTKAITFDGIMANQLCNALVPYGQSDGKCLWCNCLDVPESVVAPIDSLMPLILIAGHTIAAHYDPEGDKNAPLPIKLFIGIINTFFAGTIKLHT
ncbi:MAG: hypothetical protein H6679_03015 [Epsilonproteobacteria bacterium]|nr:hypothetical protein [Campylobacterota bacterium]